MSNNNYYDYITVGGGIVGLATAYKLQLKFPNKSIAILEKEDAVGKHQTGRNSGVMHSGIYYKPGSFKALNCKNGHEQLINFAQENNIKHDVCGKIIVATHESEIPTLEMIYQRGVDNGTRGITYLNKQQIKKREPFINGVKAILVPTAGIIDFVKVGEKFAEKIHQLNQKSELITACKVLEINASEKIKEVKTSLGIFKTETIIFCGGLQADRLAELDNVKLDMQIVGFRGDYFELTEAAKHKIKHLVYPVPDPNFPFLGVHFTRMVDGSIECGPNAVFTFKREGYHRTSFSLKDTWQALTFSGTWKLFFKHWRKGLDEYHRAFSRVAFVKALQKLMPSITVDDVQPARAGVRAQAIEYNGNLIDDFKIYNHNGNIHVLNAPSPAATACMAIADEIVGHVDS
ncbi:MAG: L-2-hydroxyglutarate oxidase [Flavobacteriaceae bacterium]|nr:L-2-hydroxyglutarate oxidase [Flavobacteriaceae bacterium]